MSDREFLVSLGSKIKSLRMQRNMTQNTLAMACNFDKASMSRIESGQSNITLLTLKKIASALNVGLVDFFTE